MGSRSKGRWLPSFLIIIMITLKDFSDILYDFHQKKSGLDTMQKLLDEAKECFINNLSDLDPKELAHTSIKGRTPDERKHNLIAKCNTVINESERAISKYIDSSGAEGIEDFYSIFFDSNKPLEEANVQEISPRSFYRMRKTEENKKYEFYKRKEIFLISKEKEQFISSARFNDAGQPCLYLASSLYLAWEECRRPNFNLVNFSRFQNVKTLKVIRISIVPRMNSIGDFIMGYFTLLCCMKIRDGLQYNFQYKVSNMFIKILTLNILRGGDIDGISFLSSRRFDCEDFLFNLRYNDDVYVFPPKKPVSTGVCPELAKLFKLTQPKTYFLFKAHRFLFDARTAFTSDYNESLFAMIEKQLNSKHEPLDYYDK